MVELAATIFVVSFCVGLGVLVMFVIASAIGSFVEGVRRDQDHMRAVARANRQHRGLYAMPLDDLRADVEEYHYKDAQTALREREQYGNHPDANLFPEAVRLIAKIESQRRAVAMYTAFAQAKHPRHQNVYDGIIAEAKRTIAEGERALATARWRARFGIGAMLWRLHMWLVTRPWRAAAPEARPALQ